MVHKVKKKQKNFFSARHVICCYLTLEWHFCFEFRQRLKYAKQRGFLLLFKGTYRTETSDEWSFSFFCADRRRSVSCSPTWYLKRNPLELSFTWEQTFEIICQWEWPYLHLLFSENLNESWAGLSTQFPTSSADESIRTFKMKKRILQMAKD